MQYTINTGYEVRQISFPFSTDIAPNTIERETRSGLTGTATSNQILKLYTYASTIPLQYGYGISTDSLGLANGEYLNYAKATLGTVAASQQSHDYHYNFYDQVTMHLMGRLATGVNSAMVNVQTRTDDGVGGVVSGSQNSITGTVTRSTTTSAGYHFLPKFSSTSVTAGQRSSRTMTLREPSNEYTYGQLVAFTDPTIYIRKPTGVEVYSGNIIVKEMEGGEIPFIVNEYTTAQGAEIVAISIPKEIGAYFDGEIKKGVEVTFDFRPSIETMGVINWHDYIVADTAQNHFFAAYNSTLSPIQDTYDANDNGTTGENMMRLNTATTQIHAANALLMDTYLIPE